jgi:hypothetical protein
MELDLGLAYEEEQVVPDPGWGPHHDPNEGWSVIRTAHLARRWLEGATGQQIADELGVTRSAVMGKVNKLRLVRDTPKRVGAPALSVEQALASLARYEAKHGPRGTRKAYAALGDDVSFSRFVKVPHDGPTGHVKSSQIKLPGFGGAIEVGRSLFHKRGVKPVAALKNLLVSGHSNVKIGNDVRLGEHHLGYRIYTLSLEERATCPSSCLHWRTCYGNNMPYAKRVDHREPRELERRLEAEIQELLHKPWPGILIRLHALGDFFDESYVDFWANMLAKYDRLAVYGYTARRPSDPIGGTILDVKNLYGRRFAVRWSDGGLGSDCTVSIRPGDPKPAGAFLCPEQTGRVAGCGKCGLCWNKTKDVAFVEH